jgi:hypothetical protein
MRRTRAMSHRHRSSEEAFPPERVMATEPDARVSHRRGKRVRRLSP